MVFMMRLKPTDSNENKEDISCMCLYYTFILATGLTLLITLIYGLTVSKDTISSNMLTYVHYRLILSACVFLQMGVWTLCLYSKQDMDQDSATWGFLTMGIVICSWVGLSTILTGTAHSIFVVIFMASFLVNMLILCHLTWQEEPLQVLRLSVAFILLCSIAMLILYNHGEFYIMEHVAFISYSLVFMSFFLIHTPSQWGILPEGHPMEYELGCEWQRGSYIPVYSPHNCPIGYSDEYNCE